MRGAILDLGTNTFNLIIGELKDGALSIIFSDREIVKLGEGGLDKDIITSEAFKRGIKAIGRHLETIADHNCTHIKTFATSGIRSTSNGLDFIQAIKENYNLDIEIISGDREAELIWKGVRQCYELTTETLIMDIGGGSTEFIIADKDSIYWKQSFRLGASRLKETFKPDDPISHKNVGDMMQYFRTTLSPLLDQIEKYSIRTLVGSSGSFDTFAEMILHKKGKIHQYITKPTISIDLSEFEDCYQYLLRSTYEERLKTPGIIPMRADMIVVSGLLTKFVIEQCDIREMHLSKFALKEGAIAELLR